MRSGSGRLIAVSLPAFGTSTQRLPAGEDVLWFAAAERAFSSGESAFARLLSDRIPELLADRVEGP